MSNLFWKPLLFLTIAIAAAQACVPREGPVPEAKVPAAVSVAAAPGGAPWQVEWDRVVGEAKKEGVVSVYGGNVGSSARDALTKAMAEKFNIRVDILMAGGGQIVTRIGAERRAGLYIADVYLGGTGAGFMAKPEGFFDPLEPLLLLPEVLDKKAWFEGDLPWADKDRYVFAFLAVAKSPVVINTQLVQPDEIRSWRDLLNPKWKDKIVFADPSVTGEGVSVFAPLALEIMDLNYLRELGKQNLAFTRDPRQLAEWVARGKYAIGIALSEAAMAEFAAAGAPMRFITPKEGSYTTASVGTVALINRAPHPNAAKVFINWLLTKEGQTVFSRAYGNQSARVDVSTDFLPPELLRQPGIRYVNTITEEWATRKNELTQVAREMYNIK